MPSGNATFTYTGPEDSIDVQGEIFAKDVPTVTHDNGVIAALSEREDFAEGERAKPVKGKKA